jgi:hypothetical protein
MHVKLHANATTTPRTRAYIILPDRRAQTAAAFLARFLASFPLQVHPILTDNGSEFTDRFAADKPNKPEDKPSGNHPFDALCRTRAIRHRLTQPFHPKTNGMAERSTAASESISARCRKTAPPTTTALSTTHSVMPTSP